MSESPAKRTPYRTAARYGAEELEQLRQALEQGSLFYTAGEKVFELERRFAESLGAGHAVATSSGTAAIHAALIALGISPGDEVITAPITDMGTVTPILFQGAVPVFADLLPHTYNLDPASVEARITPHTKAIIAVHLAGNACDLDALRRICDAHDLYLIEDCAQAFGCRYRGQPVGTIGDVGCFSLNEFKHISCGDGGLAVTGDAELAPLLRQATDKAYDRSQPGRHPEFLGNNYRMTELQAAVAIAQLAKLDGIVARRRELAERFGAGIAELSGLHAPEVSEGCEASWWFYMMRVDAAVTGRSAADCAEQLGDEGIPASAGYIGQCVYEYPVFANHSAFRRGGHAYERMAYGKGLCPVAEEILEGALILGIRESWSDADLEETLEGFRRVFPRGVGGSG